MATPEDLVTHHVTVLRRCGLSDEDIYEVYGITDPPEDVAVDRVVQQAFDGEFTPRNLYDQTHRVLAAANRGIDAPREYPNRVVPQQLDTVMGAFGFSMYFLDGNGDAVDAGTEPSQPFRIALEDPNGNVRTTTFEYPESSLDEHNYPALIASIESDLLDGVPLTFAMLSDWAEDRWRFVLFESDRLDALESHYGEGINAFGEPLLHEQRPADLAAAVAEPERQSATQATTESTADAGGGDGNIEVDETTQGWLGSGGADLSDVDIDGSAAARDDSDTDSDADDADDTGLADVFSAIEESADASGGTGIELESTGKSVEELVGGTPSAEAESVETETANSETADASTDGPETAEAEAASAESQLADSTAAQSVDPAVNDEGPETVDAPTANAEGAKAPTMGADEVDATTMNADEDETTIARDDDATEPATADAEADGFVTADPEQVDDGSAAEAESEPSDSTAESTESSDATTADVVTADAAPSDVVSSDLEPAGTEPVEAKPAEAAPVESAPAEEESDGVPKADGESAESEPAEPVPAGPESGDATSGDATSGDAASATDADSAKTESSGEPMVTNKSTRDDDDGSDDSKGLVGRFVAALKGIF